MEIKNDTNADFSLSFVILILRGSYERYRDWKKCP
jgi:hypothetical protein